MLLLFLSNLFLVDLFKRVGLNEKGILFLFQGDYLVLYLETFFVHLVDLSGVFFLELLIFKIGFFFNYL